MAKKAAQDPSQSAASPWTRPPERPTPYRLPSRLSDMVHGWLDGKRGIPRLPDGSLGAAPLAVASDAEADEPGARDPAVLTKPPDQLPALWTPRIEVLVRQSRELIEDERIRFADDWSVLKKRSIEHQLSLDPLRAQATAYDERLNQARVQPSNEELGRRRLAEQDAASRPDALVNARRRTAWDRRLRSAEEQHQSATARFSNATHSFRLHEDLIRERAEVARAAARRHHELALRRVATYLQQLIRKHPDGAELNDWLMAYRVGPELPHWARESADTESAIRVMVTDDDPQKTGTPSAPERK